MNSSTAAVNLNTVSTL